jgi:hypothetical protein
MLSGTVHLLQSPPDSSAMLDEVVGSCSVSKTS